MYNFDPYNVLLSIATNIPVTYDCFCAAGSQICFMILINNFKSVYLKFNKNDMFRALWNIYFFHTF